MFRALLTPLDLPDAAATADDLVLIRDGAMVNGYLGDPAALSASFFRSSLAVIAGGRQLSSES